MPPVYRTLVKTPLYRSLTKPFLGCYVKAIAQVLSAEVAHICTRTVLSLLIFLTCTDILVKCPVS